MNQTVPQGKYPHTVYRVSIKAIIENDHGEVLCVKENGSEWTLPGGGIDHGESIRACLLRELDEEVAAGNAAFTMEPVGHDAFFMKGNDAWLMWALYRLHYEAMPKFKPGIDGDSVAWIDPKTFKDSEWLSQQAIYKWCVDQNCELKSLIGY